MTRPVERILAKLPDAKKSGAGWSARCPAHDDRRASLSIAEGDDGRALVNCHAGCGVEAICGAIGMKPTDLFVASTSTVLHPTQEKHEYRGHDHGQTAAKSFAAARDAVAELERRHGPRSAQWTYHDATGAPVGVVVRWDLDDGRKDYRPVSRNGVGWVIGGMPEPRPLYCLQDLTDAKRIYVCEGEKAADAARSLGVTATTSAHGCQSPDKSDWKPLAGKEVVILPDNDSGGFKYAEAVVGLLARLTPAAVIKLVELAELPAGGDIVEWIEAHGDAAEPDVVREQLDNLADVVEALGPDGPVTSRNCIERFEPFPTHALPEPMRGFVIACAKAIGCDVSYVVLPLLTALAAAIGNTRRLLLKRGWTVPAILWTAIVGESGTAKTPAFKLVMRPIRERQRKALQLHAAAIRDYEIDLAHWEKAMTAWKRDKNTLEEPPEQPKAPEAERCVVSDTTVEALAPLLLANSRGLLLARDELAGWIGSFDRYAGGKGGADAAQWLSMHNGESITVDRKTGIPRTIFVPRASVCVAGGIQPTILHRALGTEHRESGLAARLLLSCPPRKAKRWTDADIDPAAEVEIARLLDRLYDLRPTHGEDGEPLPVIVGLTAEAKTEWKAYYNAHAKEQVDLTGDLSAAWSKLEEYAARLALVVHFVRWAADDPTLVSAEVVDVASVKAGVEMAKWFKHEVLRVYALLGETDDERDQRRLVEWIERKGGSVTARETQMGCRWLREAGAAEAALDALVKAGLGTWESSPRGQRGQPTRRFRLSTASTVNSNSAACGENSNTVDVDASDGT